MASLYLPKWQQFHDDSGDPLNAGTLTFYVTTTTTPKSAYPTETDAIAGTNGFTTRTLDADGRCPTEVWLSGRYRIITKTSAGTTIADDDPVEDVMPASDFQDGSPSWAGTAGGTATALTLTLSPAITAYTDGMEVGWRWNADTTGATTLNVNGVGAKSLVKRDGTAIAAGDGQQNDTAKAKYNSTQNRFELMSPDGVLYRDGINAPARADVASAATVNLDAAGTNYVRITGTTTITAITLADGRRRDVVFGGALTLTNGASMILPGGANITTAAGDTATFIGEASGVVRCLNYSMATAAPDGLLSISSPSAASQVDLSLPVGFRNYELLYDLTVSSDNTQLILRVSTDGGATFKSGATDYGYAFNVVIDPNTNTPLAGAGTAINITSNIGSSAGEGVAGRVTIYNPNASGSYKFVTFQSASLNTTPVIVSTAGGGCYKLDTNSVSALRLLPLAGNITGSIRLYGRR